MRMEKIILLDDRRTVVINELRVREARKLIAEAEALNQFNIMDLLTEHFAKAEALLGDCLQLPTGESLDDLSSSEALDVIQSFLEVNASFLDLLALLGLIDWVPTTHSQTSIEPVSSSSSAAT